MLQLPDELLQHVARSLDRDRDINALARTNRRFFSACNGILYHHNVQYRKSSALSWAAINGNDQTARKAIAAGATGLGEVLGLSAENGQIQEMPMAEHHINSQDASGLTAVWKAAECQQESIVRILLESQQVDLGVYPDNDKRLLFWAAMEGHKAVLQLLLDSGKVEIDARDELGQTPLSWASLSGQECIVRILLGSGRVDIHSRNNDDKTALVLAMKKNHQSIVDLLQSHGAFE
ncbi:ankyrin repeat-containing domain protein [Bisporella sp. PMI_857]|nr:ankyrin repeat-containing domain protein [Bisporella sp. PMI_857]